MGKRTMKDIQPILATVKKTLAARPEIVAAYLYGSYAKGYARADSDIDVAVMLKPGFDPEPGYDYMFRLENEVNEKVKEENKEAPHVEVIPLSFMGYPLKYTSSLFGKLIYGQESPARIQEEERLFHHYEDLNSHYELRHQYTMAEVEARLANNDKSTR